MTNNASPLLAAAAAELLRLGGSLAGLLRVEVIGPDGLRLTVECHHAGPQAPPATIPSGLPTVRQPGACPACGQLAEDPPRGLWLSPTEQAIVSVLGRGMDACAGRCGVQRSAQFQLLPCSAGQSGGAAGHRVGASGIPAPAWPRGQGAVMNDLTPQVALEDLARQLEHLREPAVLILKRRGVRARWRIVPAEVTLERPPPQEPVKEAPATMPALAGDWLSPTERAILAAVGDDWKPAREIAASSGQSVSSYFQAILSNLAERGILESGHRGYRRRPAGKEPPS